MEAKIMRTKITKPGHVIAIVFCALVFTVVQADFDEDIAELASMCAVYSAEAASEDSEYLAEADWWSKFLEAWLDGNIERTDSAIALIETRVAGLPDADSDDSLEASELRSAKMVKGAELCIVTKD